VQFDAGTEETVVARRAVAVLLHGELAASFAVLLRLPHDLASEVLGPAAISLAHVACGV
jgi:hypothetical protein